MHFYALLFLFIYLTPVQGICSELPSVQLPALENYIKIGLENNLALRQKSISYQQSIERLNEARGYFYPSVQVDARYSRAGGGRIIDIPVGDMLNPIHKTLNALLQENRFPTTIPNQFTPFLREREQETKLRVIQQLYDPRIFHNYKLKSHQQTIAAADMKVYIRSLTREIKIAYFNYLKALNIIDVYKESLEVLRENKRVTQKLFEADKVTKDIVYRAETEYNSIMQEYHNAANNRRLARSYFNFLLNRSFEDSIAVDSIPDTISEPIPDLIQCKKDALARREEITQIHEAVKAAEKAKAIAKSEFYPRLYVVADYGIQGQTYRLTDKDDYWMVSGIVEWNIFRGFSDKAKIQEAILEEKKLKTLIQEIEEQIELEVEQKYHSVLTSREMVEVASLAAKHAKESYRMMAIKYKEGIASYIEYLDAQATRTRVMLNEVITRIDYFIGLTELEAAMAAFES